MDKKMSKIIDQRDVKIPTLWAPLAINSSEDSQHSESIIVSGNDKELTNTIVNMLDEAQQTAILCSFLLADEDVEKAIEKAANRGIRIYLLLACETRLDNDTPDDDFGKMCLEQHKNMLKNLAGKVMIRSASHYHAKVVLIDAIGEDCDASQGMLLTANLTKEALERNEELAVMLSQSEIEEMVKVLKWAIFENAEHQMLDNTDFKSVKPLDKVPHPNTFEHIVATTSEMNTIRSHALELINSAESELIISSFGWQEDHEITEAICKKAKESVKVIILTRIRPRSMSTLIKLKSAGALVFGFKWLHAKAIWNDSNNAMVMSANLHKYGLDSGFEMGIKLLDNKAYDLKVSLSNFLKKTNFELHLNNTLGNCIGQIKVWNDKDFHDIEVIESTTESLKTLVTKCASNLDEQADIPPVDWINKPAHKIEYKWRVEAPVLPKEAKEFFIEEKQLIKKDSDKQGNNKKKKDKYKIVKRPYNPKVYSTKTSQKLIAIENDSEMSAAIKLRNKDFSNANIVLLKP